jgi:hypothetical protein
VSRQWETLHELAPVQGTWSFDQRDGATFFGKEHFHTGVCLSRMPFIEGDIQARIQTNGVLERINERVFAGVLLGYKSLRDECIAVGIGGDQCVYSIRRYNGGIHDWVLIAGSDGEDPLGSHVSCPYWITLRGLTIELHINNLNVLTHTLREPLESTNFALFAVSESSSVTFAHIMVRAAPLCLFDFG